MVTHKCEECKKTNMAVIEKPKSKKEEKTGARQSFVICRNCDPVMASFELLDNGYEELKIALNISRKS